MYLNIKIVLKGVLSAGVRATSATPQYCGSVELHLLCHTTRKNFMWDI